MDVQSTYCKNILDAKGYEVVDIVKDNGFSGKDLNRPGIQKILSNIGIDNQARKFDGIIFHRLDRLSRNPRDIYKLTDIFDKYKIEFISVQESLDTSTPMGRMMIGMFALLAEFERGLVAQRVKASALARVREGKYVGSLLPYGYKRIDNGPPLPNGRQPHKIVPDEKITPKLKLIWEKVIENKSLRTIAKELGEIGLKSYAGRPWRVQSLQIIIRNPFYKGILRYNEELHKGEHKAIVSSEIWDRANQIIGTRLPIHRFVTKPKPYIYLLEGLLKCGHCGSALVTYHAVGRSGEKFPYYVCSRKHQNLGCNSTLIPAAKFDRDFVSYLKDCSRDPKIIGRALKDAVSETQNQLSHLSKNIHKIEKLLAEKKEEADRILDIILKGAAPKGPTVKDRLAKTEAENAALQEKLDKLLAAKKVTEISADSQNFIHTNLIFLTEMFNKIAPEAQKTMLQLLIKEIQLHDDRIRLTLTIGRSLENNIPPGILPDDVKIE